MEIVRCEKGHFYDANVNNSCPQCAVESRGGYGLSGFGQPGAMPPKVPTPSVSPLSPTEPVSPPCMEIGATVPVTNSGFSPADFSYDPGPARPSEPVPPTSKGEGFDNISWAFSSELPRSGNPSPAPAFAPGAPVPPTARGEGFDNPPWAAAEPPRSGNPAPEPTFATEAPAPSAARGDNPPWAAAELPRSGNPNPTPSFAPAVSAPPAPPAAQSAPAAVDANMPQETPLDASNPVVGWLVCVEGPDKGRDYHLRSGYNYIGRVRSMDVCLTDETVSAENAALIGYDDQERTFSFAPAGGRGIVRANDKMVIGAVQLAAYDKLTIGATKLMFIPFCGERFNWDEE